MLAARTYVIAGCALALVAGGAFLSHVVYSGIQARARVAQLEAVIADTRRLLKVSSQIDEQAVADGKADEKIRAAVSDLLQRPLADGDSVCVDATIMRAIGDYK